MPQVSYNVDEDNDNWIIDKGKTLQMFGFVADSAYSTLEGCDDGVSIKGYTSTTKACGVTKITDDIKDRDKSSSYF